MANRTALRFPTDSAAEQSPDQNPEGKGRDLADGTPLAEVALVARAGTTVMCTTVAASSQEGPIFHPDPRWLTLMVWKLSGQI